MLVLRSIFSITITISLLFMAIDSLSQMECITKSKVDFFMHSSTHLINSKHALSTQRSIQCDEITFEAEVDDQLHSFFTPSGEWTLSFESEL